MAPEDLTQCSLQDSMMPAPPQVPYTARARMIDPSWPIWTALEGLAVSPGPLRAEVCRGANHDNPERCSINGSTAWAHIVEKGSPWWRRTVNGSDLHRDNLPTWTHYTLPFSTTHVTLIPTLNPAVNGRFTMQLDGKTIRTGEQINIAMSATTPTPHMHILNITSTDRVYSAVYAFNLTYPVCHTSDTGIVGPGVPRANGATCTTTAGTIKGSFEWKVDYALQHGCELTGSVTAIPAPLQFVQELKCPAAMQSGKPPRVDSMSAAQDHQRPWGECHIPQTPSIDYHAVK